MKIVKVMWAESTLWLSKTMNRLEGDGRSPTERKGSERNGGVEFGKTGLVFVLRKDSKKARQYHSFDKENRLNSNTTTISFRPKRPAPSFSLRVCVCVCVCSTFLLG